MRLRSLRFRVLSSPKALNNERHVSSSIRFFAISNVGTGCRSPGQDNPVLAYGQRCAQRYLGSCNIVDDDDQVAVASWAVLCTVTGTKQVQIREDEQTLRRGDSYVLTTESMLEIRRALRRREKRNDEMVEHCEVGSDDEVAMTRRRLPCGTTVKG
nr:hypothetical protein CFP56_04457 [Quercus suber]